MSWFDANAPDAGGMTGRGLGSIGLAQPPQGVPTATGGGGDVEALKAAYRQYLGRDASDAEIQSQLGQRGVSAQQIIASLPGSAEGRAFAARGGGNASAPAVGGSAPGSGKFAGMDPQQAWQAAVAELGLSPGQARGHLDQITNYLSQHGQPGWKATGEDTIIPPGGGEMDVLPAGDRGWQWINDAGGVGGGGQPAFSYPEFQGNFSYAPFEAPTGITEQNDPGFKARLQEGQDALQRSAAAKGTLLTGGTLKDLTDYSQNLASNEFSNVYNRALQTYGTNYGVASDTYNKKYGQYSDAYNRALGAFTTNFGVDTNLYNRAFGESQAGWGRQMDLANFGFGAAGANANAAGQYGANAANTTTGIGNVKAAGQVGSANAWQGALGDIGNAAMGGYYGSLYGRGRTSAYDLGM